RQSANSGKNQIPPAICKEFAGIPAKPCKFYRAISDDSRVGSTASEFFTDDRIIVFAGNFVGAFTTAALMFYTTQCSFGGGVVGLMALSTGNAKTSLTLVPALSLGIMCNALVCLGVWMCFGARTTVDKVFSVVPPIAAFVAAGFEHSIANAYFIPMGLFIKA